MQLKRIQALIQGYKKYLDSVESDRNGFIWESQQIFQMEWDLEAGDLRDMYDRSFQNSQTRRLWNRENYEPKRMMLQFLELQPDYVQFMFRDLYNEDKEIGGRVDRFVFYCDELLKAYKEAHPHSIENNHFHDDDYQMVSVYLAFRYPALYTIYRHESFVKVLQAVGSPNLPRTNDFPRFAKVMRTLSNFLKKDEEVVQLRQRKLDPNAQYKEESLILVYDFYHSFLNSSEVLLT